MAEALKLDGLYKNFGALQVVRDISLRIPAEERRVVIIGPNGAGKTTLFNLISGELPAVRQAPYTCSAVTSRRCPLTAGPGSDSPAPSR